MELDEFSTKIKKLAEKIEVELTLKKENQKGMLPFDFLRLINIICSNPYWSYGCSFDNVS